MSFEIGLLLALLVTATVLFAFEWLSVDLVALLLVAALVISGILTPEQAFAGFAGEIIIILASIFVLSGALVASGASRWLGRGTDALMRSGPRGAAARLMALSAGLSAFLNNTSTTAVLLPAVVRSAQSRSISPSRLLMPLAFASMLGGTCTLIGTSTNVAASGLLREMGLEPFGMFEFSAVGLIVVGLGILYLTTLGMRLLPEAAAASLTESYDLARYLAEVAITEGSRLDGVHIRDAELHDRGIHVVAITRGDKTTFPTIDHRLTTGDVLLVQAGKESLLSLYEDEALHLVPAEDQGRRALTDDSIRFAEAIVMPQSRFIGRSLRELRFRRRYGVSVLAIHRRGKAIPVAIADLRLKLGDMLLIEGPEGPFTALGNSRDLRPLGEIDDVPRRRRPLLAVGALAAAVVSGSAGLLPLPIGFLLAAIAVVIGGCMTVEEAYDAIEWHLLILIGGMTSFGVAMQETGTATYLADLIAGLGSDLGPTAVLAGFALLTILLTQPMSNAAAVLVVLPVAIGTASQLGVSPRTFAVAVTLAGSLSFITPFEPACLLVYGPGKYHFRDFVRVGLPLSAIALVVLVVAVPWLWPFEATG